MSERPLVEIYCEGNREVGYGHIRRSSTLAAQLEHDGVDVRVSGLSDDACRMLPAPKHRGRVARAVVFDSPSKIDAQIQAAYGRGQITVTLDWFGETIPNVNIAVYPHGEVRPICEAYRGFEYILIRKDVALLHRTKATGEVRHVLVVLGGGDVLNQGHEVACRLRDEGLDVTLIQGPLAENMAMGVGYRSLINPPELPQLLASCDWVVTNGGGCFFEALCVGRAAFVLPQTDAELRIACFARERGAVLGIGLDCLRKFHLAELRSVAECGVKLVDGQGAERVSSVIRGLL